MTLSKTAYLDHLRRESARFVDVLRDADPSTRVPSCPDWDADDLLWHLGKVQGFWAGIVADLIQDPSALVDPERPDAHNGLVAFMEHQTARLHDVLRETDPSTAVWTWSDDHTVGFILRRQAHEALIHRLDAELTCARVTPLDAELAGDGLEETLDVMYGSCPDWATFTSTGTRLAVEATDTGQRVVVALGRFTGTDPEGTSYDEDDIAVIADDGQTSDVTIRGIADDLDAWLWHRRDDAGLTVDGDQATFARFTAVIGPGVQ